MRREFHPILLQHMRQDPRIHVLTWDLGYGMFNAISAEFPERFHNVGASEQLLVGAGVGLALAGKIPVCFSITPFLLGRPFEWHRNYIDHEGIPVKLLGGGRGGDYSEDGMTHHAYDDREIVSIFPRIISFWPETVAELPEVTEQWLYNEKPSYLNLKR
jgi:transketolase